SSLPSHTVDISDVPFPLPSLAEFPAELPIRRSPPQPMNHRAVALGLQASLNATHLPLAQVKESRGLALCPLAQEHAVHNRQDISLVLTHLDPVLHRALLGVMP